jgi:hypothetical protein
MVLHSTFTRALQCRSVPKNADQASAAKTMSMWASEEPPEDAFTNKLTTWEHPAVRVAPPHHKGVPLRYVASRRAVAWEARLWNAAKGAAQYVGTFRSRTFAAVMVRV